MLQKLLLLFSVFISFNVNALAPMIPPPPKLAASGYLLMDFQSGQLLASENPDARLEPASLTKILTSYVVFSELTNGQIKLDDMVRVSEKAWRTTGSRMFIEVGKQVSVRDLLKGMVIQSGNDASVALAEYVAGSEEAFVTLMNNYAQQLGMTSSHFDNSTGLPSDTHYTTPRDVAQLSSALIRQFPEYYKWFSEKRFKFNNISQNNRNLLLFRDESVDGLKTGHTEAAGYCLVASAQRESMRLITVVMGTRSERARAQETQKLINYGFRFFETHLLYKKHEALTSARVWKGAQPSVQLGLADDLYITIARGQYSKMNASMAVEKQIIAPLEQGKELGSVNIELLGNTIAKPSLISLHPVAEGSIIQRLKDYLLMLIQ
jgi:D-alanyl-D-alanine carboxypeptidase (penicillin-binding protein 5/6)